MENEELEYRKELARTILSEGISLNDLENEIPDDVKAISASLAADLRLPFPDGLRPIPQPISPVPGLTSKLPKADVAVITWTIDEQMALCDVLTPKMTRDHWYRYARNFEKFDPLIRRGAPAKNAKRLGSYFLTKIGDKNVLCIKSELHLNQDGIQSPPHGSSGNATLPVRNFFHQILDETDPLLIITTGTAGAVFHEHDLGDVLVTRGAKFRVQSEFRNAPFANKMYACNWNVPKQYFDKAIELMQLFKDKLAEPEFLPPTVNFAPLNNLPKPVRQNVPNIILDDGNQMPRFHPILTTDFFEFGTSTNHLEREGCGVEMGDAVLGLVIEERKGGGMSAPNWLVIRNCSDPQINGELRNKPAKQSLQAMWAVYYYKGFGYWTSVMSAITTWAIIAGLPKTGD